MASVPEINDPRDVFSQISPVYDISVRAKPGEGKEGGYYGLPILKRPFWKWEIAGYFFFEGISAGAYILTSIAELIDQEKYEDIARSGRYLAFATMLACPPLLIADLGRPERFHHMLRIFKKTSPMNHGAWALSGYGTATSALVALMLAPARLPLGKGLLRLLQRVVPRKLVSILGLPFAIIMVSYPGVLLETTANPVWSRSNYLGPLLACSSMSSGAAALTLLHSRSEDHDLHRRLTRFEDCASGAEAAALALYVGTSGPAARPLTKGSQRNLFVWGAIGAGILLPAILRRSRSQVARTVVAPLLTIAGAFALKWSITYAGQESALDPEQASKNAPSKSQKPFWGPAERSSRFEPPK